MPATGRPALTPSIPEVQFAMAPPRRNDLLASMHSGWIWPLELGQLNDF